MKDNKLLVGQEDYWEGYRSNIDKMKKEESLIEFDKLCFHVFGKSDEGKQLLEYFKERMLLPSIPGSSSPNFDKLCIYYEGYREAFRQLIMATKNYVLRKESEDKQAIMNSKGMV